jgi:lipopolysaccharide export system permease protein
MARSFRRTWFYVGREFLLSFVVAFLFFFFIFFVNQILVMAEEIFSRKVPFWDVLRLVIYSLPWVVALSFPLGSLVGALMAVGRLTSDNEVLALGALGIPSRQMLVPLLVLGFAFTLVSFVMNDYFMPLGNIRFAQIYRRILYTNPAVELEARSVKRYEDTTIITGDIEGATIKDLVIIDRSPERNRRIITAKGASLSESAEQKGVVSLRLDEVFSQVSSPKERDRYEYTLAREMIYTILLKNIGGVTIGGLNPSYQSSVDVWREIKKKSEAQAVVLARHDEKVRGLAFRLSAELRAAQGSVVRDPLQLPRRRETLQAAFREWNTETGRNVGDQGLQSYLVEFYRKFSVPVGCIVFAFFAFPVGLRARRSGRSVGFAVGLFVSIVYWGLLYAGMTFGVRMSLSPALSMWFPDALVLAAGVVFLAIRVRR